MGYASINDYKRYLLQELPRATVVTPGKFYAYTYDFNTEYEYPKLKFFDFMPLTFVFNINTEDKYFTGINFHQMPVRPRIIWLNRMKKLGKTAFEHGGIRRIPGFNYQRLLTVLRKSKVAIRNYKFENVVQLRGIPLEQLDEVMRYYARTYFGVGIAQIQNRYNSFVP